MSLIEITYQTPPIAGISPNWIFCTSQHAVHAIFKHPQFNAWLQTQSPQHIQWAAVGAKTAQTLKQYHITPHFVPSTFSAQHAATEWSQQQQFHQQQHQQVLWPCSNIAQPTLLNSLTQQGHVVTPWPVYTTTPKTSLTTTEITTLHQAQLIGLTSPSGVTALQQQGLLKTLTPSQGWLVIGPSTYQALQSLAPNPTIIQAYPHTLDGMALYAKQQLAKWVLQSQTSTLSQ